MPGLLDRISGIGSNPLVGLGAGLLGASGPSRMPVSFGQALGQGLLGAQQASRFGAQQKLAAGKLEEQQRKQQAAEDALKADAARKQALLAAASTLPPEQQASFTQLVQADPDKAADVMAKFMGPAAAPPAFEQKLAALETRLGRPLTEDEVIKFGGGGPAVAVNVGGMKPPGGYTFADPNNPAAGVVPLPGGPADPAQKATTAAGVDAAKLAQQQSDAQTAVRDAQAAYEAAIAQAGTEPGQIMLNKRRVDEARAAVALARQNLLNLGRELGPRMQEQLTPPGMLGRAAEKVTGEVLGGLLGKTQPLPTPPPINPTPPAAPAAVGEFPKPAGFSDEEYQMLLQLRREQGG